jgi:hypothetical protein
LGKVNHIADLVCCWFERAEIGEVVIAVLQVKTSSCFTRKPLRRFLDSFSKPCGYLLPYIEFVYSRSRVLACDIGCLPKEVVEPIIVSGARCIFIRRVVQSDQLAYR